MKLIHFLQHTIFTAHSGVLLVSVRCASLKIVLNVIHVYIWNPHNTLCIKVIFKNDFLSTLAFYIQMVWSLGQNIIFNKHVSHLQYFFNKKIY